MPNEIEVATAAETDDRLAGTGSVVDGDVVAEAPAPLPLPTLEERESGLFTETRRAATDAAPPADAAFELELEEEDDEDEDEAAAAPVDEELKEEDEEEAEWRGSA